MNSDPTRAPGRPGAPGPAPEADLPQAPGGAASVPGGHDAGPAVSAPAEVDSPGAYSRPAPAGGGVDIEPEAAEAADTGTDTDTGTGTDVDVDVDVDVTTLTARAAKADEYLALAQRTQADFENYRKRTLRDAKAAQERGALKLVQSLLPAIDNLDRALAHVGQVDAAAGEAGDANGVASFVAGIKHVHSDVLAALGRVGIEAFDPVGEVFDPQYHEAVAQQPVEGAQAGTVVEVFQRGYRLGDTVVRPARVVVAG